MVAFIVELECQISLDINGMKFSLTNNNILMYFDMKRYGIAVIFAFVLSFSMRAQVNKVTSQEVTYKQASVVLNEEQNRENERYDRNEANKKDIEKANKKRYKKVYRKRRKDVPKPDKERGRSKRK